MNGAIMEKEEIIYYAILTDVIYEKEFKNIEADEFFNLTDEELNNKIRTYTENRKEQNIIKAGLISYYE